MTTKATYRSTDDCVLIPDTLPQFRELSLCLMRSSISTILDSRY